MSLLNVCRCPDVISISLMQECHCHKDIRRSERICSRINHFQNKKRMPKQNSGVGELLGHTCAHGNGNPQASMNAKDILSQSISKRKRQWWDIFWGVDITSIYLASVNSSILAAMEGKPVILNIFAAKCLCDSLCQS